MIETLLLQSAVTTGMSVPPESERVRIQHHITRTTETPLPIDMTPTMLLDQGTQGGSKSNRVYRFVQNASEFMRSLPVGDVDSEDDAIVEDLLDRKRPEGTFRPVTNRFRP